jgi:hypothetical protein
LNLLGAKVHWSWAVGAELAENNIFDPTKGSTGNPTMPGHARALHQAEELLETMARVLGTPEDAKEFEEWQRKKTESFTVNTAEKFARVIGWQNKKWILLHIVVKKLLKKPMPISLEQWRPVKGRGMTMTTMQPVESSYVAPVQGLPLPSNRSISQPSAEVQSPFTTA